MTNPSRPVRIDPNFLEFIIVSLVGFLIYSNVLNGEFISDDFTMVVENAAVRDIHNWQAIWQAFHTRFIVGVTFALNYWHAGYDVFGYHLVNIGIHIVNALFVGAWARYLFLTPVLSSAHRTWPVRRIAFFASLVFLTHPIQTEGVSFITQRAESLAAMFYLLTVLAYLKARLENKPYYLICGVLSMTLGLLTKEFTVTLPAALLIHEFFFFDGKNESMIRRIGRLSIFGALVLALPLILMSDHSSRLGLRSQLTSGYFDWNYFLTEINVLRTYLRMLVWPFPQIFDYDYPIARGLSDGSTIFSIGLITAVIIYGIQSFRKHRLRSFAVGWFFVTIFIEFIHPCFVHRSVIYEHWLYLPMAGFAILLPVLLYDVFKNEKIWAWVMVLLIAFSAGMTYKRNFVWQNELIFLQENLIHAPNNANVYYAVGIAYDRKNIPAQAVPYYLKAIAINPKHLFAMNNLAIDYTQLGRKDLAVQYFEQAVKVDPGYKITYDNLAFLYRMDGDEKQAQEVLKRRNE
jgi:tetratricopeptide (TPR) repeat protein